MKSYIIIDTVPWCFCGDWLNQAITDQTNMNCEEDAHMRSLDNKIFALKWVYHA